MDNTRPIPHHSFGGNSVRREKGSRSNNVNGGSSASTSGLGGISNSDLPSGPPYICPTPTCHKSFSLKSNLRQHMNVHIKPFACGICFRKFSLKSQCKVHEESQHRVPKKEKPYKCTTCQKTYNQPGNLTRHQRIHTGKNLHVCSFCSRVFVTRQLLNNHIRSHSGVKPYRCPMCPKVYTVQGSLTVHQRTHFGKKFNCYFCQKSFTRLSSRKSHMLMEHGVSK